MRRRRRLKFQCHQEMEMQMQVHVHRKHCWKERHSNGGDERKKEKEIQQRALMTRAVFEGENDSRLELPFTKQAGLFFLKA